jgi:plasmid stabilization system protein ParE
MKRLVLAPKARADLFDIDAYIAERNPLAAQRLIERLIPAIEDAGADAADWPNVRRLGPAVRASLGR